MLKAFILFLRVIVAIILLQTLFFKFTAAPESVYIFSQLGVEPYGRLFAGLSELIASILILIPRTQLLGAAASVSIMMGAILSHVLILGIVIQNDGGLLFILANVVFISSILILFLQKEKVFADVKLIFPFLRSL